MALTERDITVAGVNCKELLSLTGYIMHCYQQYKDFNYLHIDPVKTTLEELRQKIVAEQKKLVILIPEVRLTDVCDVEVPWHCDDEEQLKARELNLKKIFRACFIADLVPIENELSGDDVEQLGTVIALKLYSQEKMVSYVNYKNN